MTSSTYDGAGRRLLVESRLSEPKVPGTVKGTARHNYRVVPERAGRLARFETFSLSPRCTASAVWSDARGIKRTIFEDQEQFYSTHPRPPLGNPLGSNLYERNYDLTRGFCERIADVSGRWARAAKESEAGRAEQPSRVSYTYDPLQQLTMVDYPLDGTTRASITVRLDLLGRHLEIQEPNSGCTR